MIERSNSCELSPDSHTHAKTQINKCGNLPDTEVPKKHRQALESSVEKPRGRPRGKRRCMSVYGDVGQVCL